MTDSSHMLMEYARERVDAIYRELLATTERPAEGRTLDESHGRREPQPNVAPIRAAHQSVVQSPSLSEVLARVDALQSAETLPLPLLDPRPLAAAAPSGDSLRSNRMRHAPNSSSGRDTQLLTDWRLPLPTLHRLTPSPTLTDHNDLDTQLQEEREQLEKMRRRPRPRATSVRATRDQRPDSSAEEHVQPAHLNPRPRSPVSVYGADLMSTTYTRFTGHTTEAKESQAFVRQNATQAAEKRQLLAGTHGSRMDRLPGSLGRTLSPTQQLPVPCGTSQPIGVHLNDLDRELQAEREKLAALRSGSRRPAALLIHSATARLSARQSSVPRPPEADHHGPRWTRSLFTALNPQPPPPRISPISSISSLSLSPSPPPVETDGPYAWQPTIGSQPDEPFLNSIGNYRDDLPPQHPAPSLGIASIRAYEATQPQPARHDGFADDHPLLFSAADSAPQGPETVLLTADAFVQPHLVHTVDKRLKERFMRHPTSLAATPTTNVDLLAKASHVGQRRGERGITCSPGISTATDAIAEGLRQPASKRPSLALKQPVANTDQQLSACELPAHHQLNAIVTANNGAAAEDEVTICTPLPSVQPAVEARELTSTQDELDAVARSLQRAIQEQERRRQLRNRRESAHRPTTNAKSVVPAATVASASLDLPSEAQIVSNQPLEGKKEPKEDKRGQRQKVPQDALPAAPATTEKIHTRTQLPVERSLEHTLQRGKEIAARAAEQRAKAEAIERARALADAARSAATRTTSGHVDTPSHPPLPPATCAGVVEGEESGKRWPSSAPAPRLLPVEPSTVAPPAAVSAAPPTTMTALAAAERVSLLLQSLQLDTIPALEPENEAEGKVCLECGEDNLLRARKCQVCHAVFQSYSDDPQKSRQQVCQQQTPQQQQQQQQTPAEGDEQKLQHNHDHPEQEHEQQRQQAKPGWPVGKGHSKSQSGHYGSKQSASAAVITPATPYNAAPRRRHHAPVPRVKAKESAARQDTETVHTKEKLDWTQLPAELWLNVLCWLSKSALACFGQSCKLFCRLSLDQSLWKSVEVRRKRLLAQDLVCIAGRQPESLSLLSCEGLNSPMLMVAIERIAARLRVLHLVNCAGVSDAVLATVSQVCGRLEELDISWSDCTDTGLLYLSQHLALPLRVIRLRGMSALTDVGLKALMERFGAALFELDLLGSYNLSNTSLQVIAQNATGQLRSLSLAQCLQLSETALLNLLSGLPELVAINLSGCKQVSDNVLANLAAFCCRLKHVNLNFCAGVADFGLAALVFGCPGLTQLEIKGCWRVSDFGLAAVVNACESLVLLNAAGTQAGVIMLAALTQRPRPPPMFLNMAHCMGLRCDALQAFVARHGQHLRELYLQGCDLPAAFQTDLQRLAGVEGVKLML